ncbi:MULTISPECIES: alpha/beta fold hydrolase [unclassified Pantoea]|uniref:alpha/beta fold hydrolase n=1 Tax=unclassified Pantoea TaxID=2630326 RepID=UPI001CD1B82B|nr:MULTISPECIES: alpha/beta hydrolase [unclassified Pantoea]MCA1179752.1 alpha/beta hydrolase [Pantoea sp. alder69]MCA1252347.1 alpha/beta hydrolase [Pantoea sp. alder70]MCA1268095.1 alpha/beta hydrolase [Pantoea sp. alder81]
MLLHLSRTLCALFIMLFSTALFAAEKHYTVTAPDGVRIAVQESGNPEGLPIIFIHGLLGSHLNWEKQLNDPQLQRYRLITYDLRGHGLSDKPQQAVAYSDGKRWADDLKAVIDQRHARNPLLVGWSLGGAVMTNYLAAFGDHQVSGAIYVDGVVELTPTLIPAHDNVYRDMISADLKTHLDGQRAFLRLCFYQQPDSETFERLLANAAMASWSMQRAVMSMKIPLAQGLKHVRVPLLFIYGEHDALINPAASLKRAKQVNPAIQTRIYSHSGHAPFIEESTRFNRDVAAFAAAL